MMSRNSIAALSLLLFSILQTTTTVASCNLGSEAINLINNYNAYLSHAISRNIYWSGEFTQKAASEFGRSGSMDDGIRFSLQYKTNYVMSRNIFGMLTDIDYYNRKIDIFNIKPIWKLNYFDDTQIALVKINVLNSIERILSYPDIENKTKVDLLSNEQINNIINVPNVDIQKGEKVALDLLIRAKIERKRLGDEYTYLRRIKDSVDKKYPAEWHLFPIAAAKKAFEIDHPRSEYEADYQALMLLLRMRDEQGVSYYEKAMTGTLDKNYYERITDRSGLRDYFLGYCSS